MLVRSDLLGRTLLATSLNVVVNFVIQDANCCRLVKTGWELQPASANASRYWPDHRRGTYLQRSFHQVDIRMRWFVQDVFQVVSKILNKFVNIF